MRYYLVLSSGRLVREITRTKTIKCANASATKIKLHVRREKGGEFCSPIVFKYFITDVNVMYNTHSGLEKAPELRQHDTVEWNADQRVDQHQYTSGT